MAQTSQAVQLKPRDETALNVILGALAFFFLWFFQRIVDNALANRLFQAGINGTDLRALLYRTLVNLALWAVAVGLIGVLIQLPSIQGRPIWRFALAGAVMAVLFLPVNLLWFAIRANLDPEVATTGSVIFWLIARSLIALAGAYLVDWPRPRVARLILFLVYALLLPSIIMTIPPLGADPMRLSVISSVITLVGMMILGAGFGVALPRTGQEARRSLSRTLKQRQQPSHPEEAQEPADSQQI